MSKATACEFCGKPASFPMCKPCGISYDRYSHEDASIMGALIWAARRTRRCARKRELTSARALGVLTIEMARLRRVIERQAEALRSG